MEKIDELKGPPVVGKMYLVPCFVQENQFTSEFEVGPEGDLVNTVEKVIYPLINHPHNDKENGQDKPHYHTDMRFVTANNKSDMIGIDVMRIFPDDYPDFKIRYERLLCSGNVQLGSTSVELIRNSNVKSCITKNKCPHRGYDLSQVIPRNGVIICPLHGLEISWDGEVLNSPVKKRLEMLETELEQLTNPELVYPAPNEEDLAHLRKRIAIIRRKLSQH